MIEHELRQRPDPVEDDTWVLRTQERAPWLRGYLGNGRLAAQVTADGGLAGSHGVPLHLMAELYDRAEGREVEHPVPLPSWSSLTIKINGAVPLRPDEAVEYSQTLDLRRGLAETHHAWLLDDRRVDVIATQAVLRHEPNLALIRLEMWSERDCDVQIGAEHDASAPLTLRELSMGEIQPYPGVWITTATRERGIPLALAMTLVGELAPVPGDAAGEHPSRAIVPLNAAGLHIRGGKRAVSTLLVAVHSRYTDSEPQAAAQVDLRRAIDVGPERLLAEHIAAWEELWRADIVVQGDPAVQRFVRAGLFSLLCSLREDVAASISPMGLSSLGYNGHIFWDADTWMYPPLLLLQPDLARGMLTYREKRLPAARARAGAEGYAGAMFPWESATDGTETTPSWARTGLKEHHITACVALAQWQYYLATGDRTWLAEHGWPVLEAAAQFWVSRVTPGRVGGYEIHDVIAADEYAEDVDNDAFTNGAARAALLAGVAAARDLGHPAPAEWQRVADGLILPRDGDLVLEFDGYDGRVIKQADVELLTYPLEHPLSQASIVRNLETYRRATDPEGPAMSRSISAIVAAQLGRREEALSLFRACYEPNLFGPFYALAETPSNGAVDFLTGVGGALQALLFGFGGIRLHEGVLAFDPLLPAGWQALRFSRLRWRGRDLTLAIVPGDQAVIGIEEGTARLELVLQRWRPGTEPLTVEVRGGEGMECGLKAEDWHVEPQFGTGLSWRIWPPATGPACPFVRLHLSAVAPHGASIVLEVEQRVWDGDA